MNSLKVIALLLVFSLSSAYAATITPPHTFTTGSSAKASEVNANFTALSNAINGNASDISALQGVLATVGFNYRNAWNSTTAYVKNDVVTNAGSSYVAIRPTTNNNPTIDVSNNGGNWGLIAQKGDTGSQGATGPIGPQGATGATGVMGPKGDTGAMGPQGATGATGATGAAGSNGTNGLNSLVSVTAEPAGSNCSAGGNKIVSGLDINGDNALQITEITSTRYVCNGANGSNGWNGLNSLVSVVAEGAGANCSTGGSRILFGIDNNSNALLEYPEVTAIQYVCNGVNGQQGADGATGATGATGVMGPKGDTGAMGPQGLAGPAGPAGPKGDKGDTGDAGPQGLQGPQGSIGPRGPSGKLITMVDSTGKNLFSFVDGNHAFIQDSSGAYLPILYYIFNSYQNGSIFQHVDPFSGPMGLPFVSSFAFPSQLIAWPGQSGGCVGQPYLMRQTSDPLSQDLSVAVVNPQKLTDYASYYFGWSENKVVYYADSVYYIISGVAKYPTIFSPNTFYYWLDNRCIYVDTNAGSQYSGTPNTYYNYYGSRAFYFYPLTVNETITNQFIPPFKFKVIE